MTSHWPTGFTPLEKDPEQCQIVLVAGHPTHLTQVCCSIHGELEAIAQTSDAAAVALRVFREHLESETV
jgi:hypothetical protein